MAFNRYRGGKLPPRRRMGVPALGDFLDKATAWPAVPPQGWEFAVPPTDLSILGNDQVGDCAEAGAFHLIQAQSFNAGRALTPTTADALALYSAVTGYDPSDPSTDQGTVLTDLLTYWQKTGVAVGSTVHKIVGYASLDISSVPQMRYAAYIFGGSYLGINCPQQCEDDTSNWNFEPGLKIAGGHCIIQAGEGAAGGKIGSWGLWIPATWEFILNYLDEAYVVVSDDWLNAQERSPTGLDLDGLVAAMKAL
jgi:hypothetical protein